MTDLEKVGRYQLLGELGRGGMSTVYLALDERLDREVAVKLLHPHLASREESAVRFQREARTVARLRHPNIVEIYDFSEEDADQSYIVVEYIKGRTLRDFVDEEGIDIPEVAAAIGVELCKALAYAHEHHIIHRDIKPENVMIGDDGAVKLMDFGIARILDADTMTATGSLLGSPAHMPPEMIDGLAIDHRGDVFSLGTVLYFLTTNILPFTGRHPSAVLRNILEGRYVPPQQCCPRLGRGIADLIERCLAVDPDDRPDSIAEVEASLRAELSALGFDEPEDMVAGFLADPAGYEEGLEPILIERLLAAAEAALDDGRTAIAGAHLNRIFAFDPEHEAATELLERMRVGQRRRWILAVAAIIVLLGGVGYTLAWLGQERSSEEGGSTEVRGAAELPEPPDDRLPAPRPGPLAATLASGAVRGSAVGLPGESEGVVRAVALLPSRILAHRHALHGAALTAIRGLPESTPVAMLPTLPRDRPIALIENRGEEGGEGETDGGDADAAVDAASEAASNGGSVVAREATRPVTFTVSPVREVVATFRDESVADDGNGRITLDLPVGRHRVNFECETERCASQTRTVEVRAGDDALRVDAPVVLNWRAARLLVDAPQKSHYYVVRIYDGRLQKEERVFPADLTLSKLSVSGEHFNWKGEALQVKIWAIPRGTTRESSGIPQGITPTVVNVTPGSTTEVSIN